MATDVAKATRQANQISSYVWELKTAKSKLNTYKGNLQTNYQSREVQLMTQEIDNINRQIQQAIDELESLRSDIVTVATRIRNEEIARINAAQRAVNNALNNLNNLKNERKQLNRCYYAATTDQERNYYINKLAKIHPKITAAQNYYNSCVRELNEAKR